MFQVPKSFFILLASYYNSYFSFPVCLNIKRISTTTTAIEIRVHANDRRRRRKKDELNS